VLVVVLVVLLAVVLAVLLLVLPMLAVVLTIFGWRLFCAHHVVSNAKHVVLHLVLDVQYLFIDIRLNVCRANQVFMNAIGQDHFSYAMGLAILGGLDTPGLLHLGKGKEGQRRAKKGKEGQRRAKKGKEET
jgi:hypothetical protein